MKNLEAPSVIALVLARGGITEFPEHSHLKYKALLPFQGRPLAHYIVDALSGSNVERVFVLAERDAELEAELGEHPKVSFISHDGPSSSMAEGLIFGLEQILGQYGGRTDKTILFLPCDIPLVKSEEIDTLLDAYWKLDADFVFTSIRLNALNGLKQRLTVFSPELGARTASQNVNFLSGRCMELDNFSRLVCLDRQGQTINGIGEILDRMRRQRRSVLLWPRLIFQFYIIRMLKNGHPLVMIESFARLLIGRLTMTSVRKAYAASLKIKVDAIISAFPSFSFDVDNPGDFAMIEAMFAAEASWGR